MSDKPFVLLGINSDPDREVLEQAKQEEGLTWRNWCDGGIDGPIHKQWNIVLRPMVYLLDERGVIRFKDVLDDELDRAVDSLVAELTTGTAARD